MRGRVLAVIGGLLLSSQANALLITTSVGKYDVTTTTTSYNTATALLQSQVWWGSNALAAEFATAVGDDLGLPNLFNLLGPFFAYGTLDALSLSFHKSSLLGLVTVDFFSFKSETVTFTVATPVPEPTSLALLGAGLLGVGLLFRRRRSLSR